MKCNKCEYENDENAKFCANCGNKLGEEKNTKCNFCGYDNIEGAKFCASCGHELGTHPDFKVCPVCGAKNDYDRTICAICSSDLMGTNVASTSKNVNTKQAYIFSGSATISLILGIVSISANFACCLFPVSIVCGICAIFFSIIAIKKDHKTNSRSLTGIILGAIGLAIGILIMIMYIELLQDPEFQQQIQDILNENTTTAIVTFLK